MNLSLNFTLEEMIATSTGIPNQPGPVEINNLQHLVNNVLQPLRNIYMMPVSITSGYRSQAVNQAVGGSMNSQHTVGMAADIVCGNNAGVFEIIKSMLPFDQLIWEGGDDFQPEWIHVSFNPFGNRGQVLRMRDGQYFPL